MDLLAVTTAIAAKYANMAAPSGETNGVRGSTAEPGDSIPMTPYVVVTVALNVPAQVKNQLGTRHSLLPVDVTLYLEQATDVTRQLVRCQRWAPSILDAWAQTIHLGLAPAVEDSYATEFELGQFTFAGQDWAGVRVGGIVKYQDVPGYTA